MSRMDAAAIERLQEANERRKWRQQSERRRRFTDATPRLIAKSWDRDRPALIRAGEVHFVPAHTAKTQSMNLSGRGPFLGPLRDKDEPDKVIWPHNSATVPKVAGRLVKPLAADLRRYDSLTERIVRLQKERAELLYTMADRGRALTADEAVTLAKSVNAIGDDGYVRPESAAKKVKVPR